MKALEVGRLHSDEKKKTYMDKEMNSVLRIRNV